MVSSLEYKSSLTMKQMAVGNRRLKCKIHDVLGRCAVMATHPSADDLSCSMFRTF